MKTEDNKLIAEFMNAVYKQDDYGDYGYWFDMPPAKEWNKGFQVDALKYDTSWDWLMPVVEKIESMRGILSIRNKWAHLIYPDQATDDFFGTTKIESVYFAITAFIQWHNEHPKTNPQQLLEKGEGE